MRARTAATRSASGTNALSVVAFAVPRVPAWNTAGVPRADESATPTGGWSDPEQVGWYTKRIGKLEARRAGEQVLIDVLPAEPRRVLDLGCGDGRLAALVLEHRPSVED